MTANTLKQIPVRRTMADTPTVLLSGEIFVRHDDISRQYIVEELADRGIATKVSTLAEWIYYTDWLVKNNLSAGNQGFKDKLSLSFRNVFMKKYERTVRDIYIIKIRTLRGQDGRCKPHHKAYTPSCKS